MNFDIRKHFFIRGAEMFCSFVSNCILRPSKVHHDIKAGPKINEQPFLHKELTMQRRQAPIFILSGFGIELAGWIWLIRPIGYKKLHMFRLQSFLLIDLGNTSVVCITHVSLNRRRQLCRQFKAKMIFFVQNKPYIFIQRFSGQR